MQVIIDLFNFIFIGPIINLLVFILRVLESSNVPYPLAMAIIVLSIVIRLLVWPAMSAQIKSAKKMSDLKPHLDALKQKHKDDKQSFAKAQMDLYKEHGVNPAGGCLPALVQIPILLALYQSIYAFFDGEAGLAMVNDLLYFDSWHLNSPPDASFLGYSLSNKPSDFGTVGFVLLLIPIITALFTFIQSKMMAPMAVKQYPLDSPKEIKEKSQTEDAMASMQSQMVFLMPIMIGYFAFQFPIGLAVYWNTFTLIGIWQQYRISKWGGLSGLLNRLGLKTA